jgi:hypothetical protein
MLPHFQNRGAALPTRRTSAYGSDDFRPSEWIVDLGLSLRDGRAALAPMLAGSPLPAGQASARRCRSRGRARVCPTVSSLPRWTRRESTWALRAGFRTLMVMRKLTV